MPSDQLIRTKGETYELVDTDMGQFYSPAQYHGPNKKRGWVVEHHYHMPAPRPRIDYAAKLYWTFRAFVHGVIVVAVTGAVTFVFTVLLCRMGIVR